MSDPIQLPARDTAGYRLLSLVAVCGELPVDQLERLPGGDSYKRSLVTALKNQRLMRTVYRDGLRGYRLTLAAKSALLSDLPDRFSFALTGASETNHIKSEVPRRLRLHRIAEVTVTMLNAGVIVHRDEKPDLFRPVWRESVQPRPPTPVFYNSREVKELGLAFVKIHGGRFVGVLLTSENVFVSYNIVSSLIRWDYKSEMRTKAMMKSTVCEQRLSSCYPMDAVQGLVFGSSMELAYRILSEEGGRQYFLLDRNYDHFYFLTSDHYGQRLLQLLCDRTLRERLESILLDDLYEADTGSTLENDAFDEADDPVLLGYFCDLQRIQRFDTGLQLQNRTGTIICFDFQKEALSRYCCDRVRFQVIDFQKWERSFFA